MIFHELATNSAKYGALSCGGTLILHGGVASRMLGLTWIEAGAQQDRSRSEGSGFGSRLLRQTIERSLGGRFERTIEGGSLHFAMTVPLG